MATFTKAFERAKYAAGVVKDTLVNMGDSIIAGQEIVGSAQAGIKVDAHELLADSTARNTARRQARRDSRKNNPYLN